MKNTDIEEKLLAFMQGQLSPDEQEEVKQYLMQQGQDLGEFYEMANIWEKMDEVETPNPSSKMRDQFYHNLAHFKEDERLKSESLWAKVSQLWQRSTEQVWLKQLAFGMVFTVIGIVAFGQPN